MFSKLATFVSKRLEKMSGRIISLVCHGAALALVSC